MMQTRNIGILLTILGIIMMIYTGFNYVTTEKIVDIGPIQIDRDENHPVQWSPIVGGVMLVLGILFLLISRKK